MTSNDPWGADVVISMPVPPPSTETIYPASPGFAFTRFGLTHDLTTSDVEGYLSPTFHPLDVSERE